ncbi:hypothetical protein QQM79_19860 [Marinobacteraceae bacterium S3BR75-40.1]
MIPAFIDFEASSLDLVASYPIEVGICLGDGEPQSWLIRPHVLWHDWSESAEQIHGICRQTLIEQGEEVRVVAERLNRLLPEQVFCDAWTFDSFWLHRLFKAANMQPSFALESVSMILSGDEVNHWYHTRQSVIQELAIDTHRAANDARILFETWARVATGKYPRPAAL